MNGVKIRINTVTAALLCLLALAGNAKADCVQFPIGVGPEEVCVTDFFPSDPITVQLGQSFSLPTVEIQNNTDRPMSFTFDWAGLSVGWGPLIIHQVVLQPQTSTSVPGLVLDAHDLLQIGSNGVALGWSAQGSASGEDDYVTTIQRNFELIGLPPEELAELIGIPVRFCVLENSPLAKGNLPGSFIRGLELAQWLQGATAPWLEQASILYRPALAPHGIPVIADPEKEFLSGIEQVGDIEVSFPAEAMLAKTACESAWVQFYPTQRGLVVNSARNLVQQGSQAVALAVAAGPPLALRVQQASPLTGRRGDDLCGHPRNLTVDDVTDQFVVLIDPLSFQPGDRNIVLAHELGHTLLLHHGNGLDDNSDGLEPPANGPRRFDGACDPDGIAGSTGRPQEDVDAGAVNDSLMRPSVSSDTTLRPLQIEQGREVAKVYPGAVFLQGVDPAGALVRSQPLCGEPGSTCTLPRALSLMRAQVATAPQTGTTTLSHTIFGPLAPDISARYASFLDLDDNPMTGCDPTAIGFPTSRAGVELVSEVALMPGTVLPTTTGRLWSCQSTGWQAESVSEVIAYGQSEAEIGGALFGIVSLRLDPVLLQGSTRMRMQAVAIGQSGSVDRLPDADPASATTIDLMPGDLLQCEAARPILPPGGKTMLSSGGFVANAELAVLVRGEEVARANADAAGELNVEIAMPADEHGGTAAITVIEIAGAANAACAAVIAGSAVTPSTSASITPDPSPAGWHNSGVTVSLDATANNVGVAEIQYSAVGAEPILPTTVPGATADVNLSMEGTTTLSYFAIDTDGTVESPRQLDIRIDATAPTISGSASPAPNANGWNNTDVTVSFDCSDSLSGLWFCSGPTVLDQDGVGQSATGMAEDLSTNESFASEDDINIDKTPPVITYTNNTTPYGLLEIVQITCSASDALSGLANDTCADITGPAYTFDPGGNTFAAQATDNAGNMTNESTTFEVIPTYADLCELTKQFIDESNPTPPNAHRLGQSLCSKLANAERFELVGKLFQKDKKIANYLSQLTANTTNFFTEEQAETLAQWAGVL